MGPEAPGTNSLGATDAKLRLLEARLTGGRMLADAEDGLSGHGLQQQQQQQQTPTPPPARSAGGKGLAPSPGPLAPSPLSCSGVERPVMQLDTSLDSDASEEEGGSNGQWGIATASNGPAPKRRRLSTGNTGAKGAEPLEGAQSRSESHQGATLDARGGASNFSKLHSTVSREKEGRKRKDRRLSVEAVPQKSIGGRGSAPSSAKAVALAPRGQKTINRYFQAMTESCSRDSDWHPSTGQEAATAGDHACLSPASPQMHAAVQTDGSLINEATKENKKLQQEIERLRGEVKKASANEEEAAREASAARAEAEELRHELGELGDQRARRDESVHGAMLQMAKRCSRLAKQLTDTKLQQDSLRLGSVGVQRAGAMLSEVWLDGPAFQEISRRQQEIGRARDDIDALRKSIKKQLPLPEGPSGSAPKGAAGASRADGEAAGNSEVDTEGMPRMTPKEIVARDDVLKARLQALKREEENLTREKERLEIERTKHIKEVKRRKDEDDSRFSTGHVLHNRYVLLHLLGKGGFSEVYCAYDLEELREVAVKIHQLNSTWNEAKKQSYVRHAVREYNIHKQLRHQRVVRLLDIFEVDNSTFATVLEVCGGGDLEAHLREHTVLPEKEAKSIVAQILAGLAYLNEPSRRIIHYDLKPANIMFDSCGEVKITDFGLSKIVEEGQTNGMELTSQGAGTYWYLPPECFETGSTPPTISSKVDVWSVGVIFYQMLYGKRPFGHELSQENILRQKTIINAQEVEFPAKPAVSSDAKDFIRRCLSHRQHNRPDVHQAASDLYVTSGSGGRASSQRGRQ